MSIRGLTAGMAAVLAVTVFAACGQPDETGTNLGSARPTPSPRATPNIIEVPAPVRAMTQSNPDTRKEAGQVPVDLSAQGFVAYQASGCVACHGSQGEGGVGPAMAGHTYEQVLDQVRNPRGGVMPAFGPEQLPESRIRRIVAWIDSLEVAEAGHAHGEQVHAATAPVEAHLRLMVLALQEPANIADATHHLTHAQVANSDAQTAEVLDGLEDQFVAADLHDVAHDVEALIGKVAALDPDLVAILHWELTRSSVQAADTERALHHMEHIGQLENPVGHDEIDAIATLIKAGDLAQAAENIQAIVEGRDLHD